VSLRACKDPPGAAATPPSPGPSVQPHPRPRPRPHRHPHPHHYPTSLRVLYRPTTFPEPRNVALQKLLGDRSDARRLFAS
jgi:hypothetical protein